MSSSVTVLAEIHVRDWSRTIITYSATISTVRKGIPTGIWPGSLWQRCRLRSSSQRVEQRHAKPHCSGSTHDWRIFGERMTYCTPSCLARSSPCSMPNNFSASSMFLETPAASCPSVFIFPSIGYASSQSCSSSFHSLI